MNRMTRQSVAQPRAAHGGFTMLELMIALLLSSIVVLAVTQLFITNQRTFVLQQALRDVQEQGRFALEYIERDARRASLVQPATAGPAPGIIVENSQLPVGVGFPPSSEGGTGATDNDRLTFSFQGDAGMEDCEGDALAAAAAPALVVSTYWVNDANQLRCEGSVDGASGGLTLVEGVDSFQVLYGIDTEDDGVPFASRYVRADDLNVDDQVLAVRVGLLVRARQENIPDLAEPNNYVVLDKELTSGVEPLDGQAVRRLFGTTVRLRNYDWGSI